MKIAKKTGIREMPVFAKFVKDSDLYYKGEKNANVEYYW